MLEDHFKTKTKDKISSEFFNRKFFFQILILSFIRCSVLKPNVKISAYKRERSRTRFEREKKHEFFELNFLNWIFWTSKQKKIWNFFSKRKNKFWLCKNTISVGNTASIKPKIAILKQYSSKIFCHFRTFVFMQIGWTNLSRYVHDFCTRLMLCPQMHPEVCCDGQNFVALMLKTIRACKLYIECIFPL